MLLEEGPNSLLLSAKAWPEYSMTREPLRARDDGWDTGPRTPGHLIPPFTLKSPYAGCV